MRANGAHSGEIRSTSSRRTDFDRDDPLFKERRARKKRLFIYSAALRENERDAQLFQPQPRLAERRLRKFFSRRPVLVPAALRESKLR
jgi:hypothetical protein